MEENRGELSRKGKDYILFLAIFFMGIEELINFEKVASKTSPYLPLFIFGYISYLTHRILFIILFISALLMSSYYLIWKTDPTVTQIKQTIFLKKKEEENIKMLAKTKSKPFLLKALLSFIMFFMQLGATIFSGYYSFRLWNIYLGIFFILSAFISLFVLLNLRKMVIASFNLMRKIKEQGRTDQQSAIKESLQEIPV